MKHIIFVFFLCFSSFAFGQDDNSIDDISKVKKALKKFKKVKVTPLDTISDKILGGLRGKRRHEIATLIKLFDSYLNKINILKATNYIIVAKKN